MVATHGDVGTALRAIPLAIASVWIVDGAKVGERLESLYISGMIKIRRKRYGAARAPWIPSDLQTIRSCKDRSLSMWEDHSFKQLFRPE